MLIYNKNDLKHDLAFLLYGYNIVGGFSTLIYTIIRFNDKLKFFWEYNVHIPSVHYIYYKLEKNITIYIMEPSKNYKKKMRYFSGNKKQLDLMIKEKCVNNFTKKILNQ